MNNPFEALDNRLERIENLLQNQSSQEPETMLSKNEASELLGITTNTLSKYTKDGTIPAYGIGSRVLYKKQEVLKSLIKIN